MTSQEKKKQIEERCVLLERQFEERYGKPFNVSGKKCFMVGNDEFFMVTGLSWENAIVIEYASSKAEAEKNMFEDGDLFYMEELSDKEMFESMVKEIEE
jgi:hypothetical protein